MLRRLTQFKPGTSAALASLAAGSLTTVALVGGTAAAAVAATPTTAKALAERRVLSVLGREWSPYRLRGFVDARTHLPLDNVQAVCRARPGQHRPPSRFVCVVRPRDRQSPVRLYLSYSALRGGGFHVHWLDLRGR